MMVKTVFFSFTFICFSIIAAAQEPGKNQPPVDSLFTDYDELFSELDLFIDSLMAPRSFTVANFGLARTFLNYESATDQSIRPVRKILFLPGISYYHRSGFGVGASANMVREGGKMNPYQFSITGSWDYLGNRKWITGISYTRFFTKDSLKFYTSPLQNAAYAYFTYRKLWVKPTIAASFGWGSRSSYYKRFDRIYAIRLRPTGYTRVNTEETVADFSVTASVRHDFYWLDVFGKNDFVRLTPQIVFVSGTQKFGFNQSTNSYATIRTTGTNVLYNSENVTLDDQLYFQPLSLTAVLKTEYSVGKFFLQPQLIFDYYFPASSNRFGTSFMINTGVIF